MLFRSTTVLCLIAAFQLLTAPVSAHMVGRAAFRTGTADREELTVCEFDTDDPEPTEEIGA